jgi:hypothetical protein
MFQVRQGIQVPTLAKINKTLKITTIKVVEHRHLTLALVAAVLVAEVVLAVAAREVKVVAAEVVAAKTHIDMKENLSKWETGRGLSLRVLGNLRVLGSHSYPQRSQRYAFSLI